MAFTIALLTPFDASGRVDLAKLRAHVLWLAAKGTDGFFATLACGEFPFLSDREREAVHRTVLEAAMGRAVYPCTWDPSPTTCEYLTKAAVAKGAKAVVLPPPLYYDLDDTVVLRWYEQAARYGAPVFLYHLPRGNRPRISLALTHKLAQEGLIQGVVDASPDPWRIRRLAAALPGLVWAADDGVLPQVRSAEGLAGAASAAGNVWPSFTRRVYEGDTALFQTHIERSATLARAGGFRALKSLKRFGCRPPMIAPDDERLEGLPPAESATDARTVRNSLPG